MSQSIFKGDLIYKAVMYGMWNCLCTAVGEPCRSQNHLVPLSSSHCASYAFNNW